MARTKPTIFIGSSSERLPIVRALSTELASDAKFLRWDKHVFLPGYFSLENVERDIKQSDFAIFVVAGDDIIKSRKKTVSAPRDNVILEIGIAIGVLGHDRLLVLYNEDDRAKIPSDLLGFTYLIYEDRKPLRKAIQPACEVIRQQLIAKSLRELPSDFDKVLTHRQRSAHSVEFGTKCIHTFDTFAGDLSWLTRDLPTYKELAKRGVRIRFLTDTPTASVIPKAKALGMSFRQYPPGADARIKASISDVDSESDARALVVQKRVIPLHKPARRAPYDYRMKIYRGPKEYPIIRALGDYFEQLFLSGTVL